MNSERQHSRQPRISFVLVTRGRPDYVRDCVESIARCGSIPVEVLVLDNSDDDSTRLALESIAASLVAVCVRYAKIPPNKHIIAVGRNRGVDLARAPIVAFIDDDVVLDQTWVAACLEAFSDPDVAAATGPIWEAETDSLDAYEDKPIGRILSDGRMAGNFYLRPKEPIDIQHARGCNFICRKSDFQQFGGFDPSFRQVYEEADLCLRFVLNGKKLRFHPALSLRHFCAPATRIFRMTDPALYYQKKEANLKFYTYLLFKNFGWFHAIPWRHSLGVETGLHHLLKERDREGLKEVYSSLKGKLSGILYLFQQANQPDLSIPTPTLEVLTPGACE